MTSVDPNQPVVILGGFLITEEAYQPMADWLMDQGVQDAQVVSVSRYDWLLTSWGFGWRRVLVDTTAAPIDNVFKTSPEACHQPATITAKHDFGP